MSTRTLVLIRHAKAVAGDGADRDRRLAPRGEADAREIGRWLAEHELAPDRVVVSPARRARQTWELAAGSRGWPEPVIDDDIYANTVAQLLPLIRTTPAGVATLALVGHNPSFEALVAHLDDGTGRDLPTSGVAVVTVTSDWADLDADSASLTQLVVARSRTEGHQHG